MADWWEERDALLDYIDDNWLEAWNHRGDAFSYMVIARQKWDSGDTIYAVNALISSVSRLIMSVTDIIGRVSPLLDIFALPYFFRNHTIEEPEEEYELTAAKIMSAWIDANMQERLMTVLTLDELRREVWNQEFISYRIAPAPRE